jgi:hypothetical protein
MLSEKKCMGFENMFFLSTLLFYEDIRLGLAFVKMSIIWDENETMLGR